MEGSKGYVWAISAGLNAALSAIAAKLFSYTMSWGGLPTARMGGKEVLGVSPNSVVISHGDLCSAMFVIGGRLHFGRKGLGRGNGRATTTSFIGPPCMQVGEVQAHLFFTVLMFQNVGKEYFTTLKSE
ncbi:multidrug resistance protein EbrB [Cucumis melo var. makuwa]|uniref:Multidrug resistance protein EbrB n=1 Tax=Cucumis melo var. makuwa TaxID=1194695 RepID=A0A5A7VC24_CUCMM|nr:multidrug resistance protein EbrB [Cucumis melo var. makuwa]